MKTIGVVSPGAMGSALGREWLSCGARVVTTVEGRSQRTRALAQGLDPLPALADVVQASDLVVSICPPGAATDVLDAVLSLDRQPKAFADLNAISSQTAIAAARCDEKGWSFIDGSISGGPPSPKYKRPTLLYLSGETAFELAEFRTDNLVPVHVGAKPGTASAIKMCTASVYKGTKALWMQALATAHHYGVQDIVFDDLASDFPDMADAAATTMALAASKSRRFVAEMENIAITQQSAGVGGELFTAMAKVYERISTTALADFTPEEAEFMIDLAEVLNRLEYPAKTVPDVVGPR